MSAYTSYVITEADKQLMLQRELRYMIKIEILDLDYKILDSIEGTIVGGSYNIDSTSDIRRTTSFSINPTVLKENSPLRISPLGYIWFDKIVHFYIGLMDIVKEEYTYYSEGFYLYVNVSSNYDAQNNELNVTLNDYMAVFNATRNGQIGTPVIIPAYEYKEYNDGHIEILKYNLLRDAMKAVVVNLGKIPYDKVIISEMGATNGLPELQKNYQAYRHDYPYWASVPYDQEFNTGVNVLTIVNTLRDLYPNFETFFSPDFNNFICQLIPSGYYEPVTLDNDFIQRILISEQSTVDLTDVKNICEVWGRALNPEYYSSDCHITNENVLDVFNNYNDDLITLVIDNSYLVAFRAEIEAQTLAANNIRNEISLKEEAIANEQALITTYKSNIAAYEAEVGKAIEMMYQGKVSLDSDTKGYYPNYEFVYNNHLGLLSSSDYSDLTLILSRICANRRTTLSATDKIFFDKINDTIDSYLGTSSNVNARIRNTKSYVRILKDQALDGTMIARISPTNGDASRITQEDVQKYIAGLGWDVKMINYDKENKVDFIDKLFNLGDAAFNAYFGSKAAQARARRPVELGTLGMQYLANLNQIKAYNDALAPYRAQISDKESRIKVINQLMIEGGYNNTNGRDLKEAEKANLEASLTSYQAKEKEAYNQIVKLKKQWKKAKDKSKTSPHRIIKAEIEKWRNYRSYYQSQIANLQARIAALTTEIQNYDTVKAYYETRIDTLNAEITVLQKQIDDFTLANITPIEIRNDGLRQEIALKESTLDAYYNSWSSSINNINSYNEDLVSLNEDLVAVNEELAAAQHDYDTVLDYKNRILNYVSLLRQFIDDNPSTPPGEEQKEYAQQIIVCYQELMALYPNAPTDNSKSFSDLSSNIDNIINLLNGYMASEAGENLLTYTIALDEYTEYKDGDEIAIKINVPNDSPATFIRVNSLGLLPVYRSKSLTDEAAINNFIEPNSLRRNVTYIFKISNIVNKYKNILTNEDEEETILFAYLQGTYQLHGLDVLSDGREHTEPYMVQKQIFDGADSDTDKWSDQRKRIADGTDTASLIDETVQFDEMGRPEMEQVYDEDGNPIMLYTREYYEKRYNCQNVHITVIPDSPYTVERLGEILDVKSGDRYDNCNTDLEILENAIYENWKNCRLTDTVTITTLLCPFLDVNVKVTYKPKLIQINNTLADDASDDEPYEYLIKSVSHDLNSLTSSITMYRYYPLFAPDNDYPTVIR